MSSISRLSTSSGAHKSSRSKRNRKNKATYIILAPDRAWVGLPYALSVNILAQEIEPVDIEIKVTNNSNSAKMKTKLKGLTHGKATIASLGIVPLEMIGSDNILQIKGTSQASGSVLFEDSNPLNLQQRPAVIFIQTDKVIYKPGDIVRFRVIAIKPDLTPFEGFADVQIKNILNAVVKQFDLLSLDRGVATGEFQLSDYPTHGNYYSLVVSIKDENKKPLREAKVKDFAVKPHGVKQAPLLTEAFEHRSKFDMKLIVPPFSIRGKDIPVKVISKYACGTALCGTVKVSIGYPFRSRIEEVTSLSEEGTADIMIKYDLLEKEDSLWRPLPVYASVKEDSTGIQRNAKEQIRMCDSSEKLKITEHGDFFRPGMDYTFTVSLVTHDGKPVSPKPNATADCEISFVMKTKWLRWLGFPRNKKQEKCIQLDNNGSHQITLKTPKSATALNITVWYQDGSSGQGSEIRASTSVDALVPSTSSFICVRREANTPATVGDTIPFIIEKSSDFPTNIITLQVICRGSVVFAETGNSSGTNTTISVPITHSMAPESRVLAYAVRSDSDEVLVDALNMKVNGVFRNDVTLFIDNENAKPQKDDGAENEIIVTVNADPESFVGLFGRDESTPATESDVDITRSEVERQIEYLDVPREVEDRTIFSSCSITADETRRITNIFGLLVFTDGDIDDTSGRDLTEPVMFMSRKEIHRRKSERHRRQSFYGLQEWISERPPVTWQNKEVRLPSPETWIWLNSVKRANRKLEYRATVPDTMSSFIISAFGSNADTGLGIATAPAQLKVLKPFFVSLDLPYSVKQGETLFLQVHVFNYGDLEDAVIVTLEHKQDSGFDFMQKPDERDRKHGKHNQRIVQVKAGGGIGTVKFPIVPTIIGYVKLLVKAFGKTATDSTESTLLVKAEGVRLHFNKPLVFDFTTKDSGSCKSTIDMMPPAEIEKDIISDSEKVTVSAFGDVMGPLLSDPCNLIRMPVVCGEPIMIKMVPSIAMLKYLEATGEDKNYRTLISKVKKHIEIGYQYALHYIDNDGSFSIFGEMDTAGSTWLTAYIIRSLIDAKDYIFVDPQVLARAISWLRKRQKANGEYKEFGSIINHEMQGGSGEAGVPLTAFVLAALLCAGEPNNKAMEYLEDKLEMYKSHPYVIAITAYALGLAKSAKFGRALDILTESAVNEGEERHWATAGARQPSGQDWWQHWPNPLDVETTSYALLSYLLVDRLQDAHPCMRWLLANRNSLGGFVTTQDTVFGTLALSKYARRISKESNINIGVTQGNTKKNFTLNEKNRMVPQSEKLSGLTPPVNFEASGKGMALAQLSWSYNVRNLSDSKPFECLTNLFTESNGKLIKLHLQCRYNLDGKCNMPLLEVEVPSGFKIDERLLYDLYNKGSIGRVESINKGTLVYIYFEQLGREYFCLEMTMHRLFEVEGHKPSQIRLIDYYQPHKTLHTEYSIGDVQATEKHKSVD